MVSDSTVGLTLLGNLRSGVHSCKNMAQSWHAKGHTSMVAVSVISRKHVCVRASMLSLWQLLPSQNAEIVSLRLGGVWIVREWPLDWGLHVSLSSSSSSLALSKSPVKTAYSWNRHTAGVVAKFQIMLNLHPQLRSLFAVSEFPCLSRHWPMTPWQVRVRSGVWRTSCAQASVAEMTFV